MRPGKAALAALSLGALLFWARPSLAHKVGLSSGEYAVKGKAVTAELVFEKGELALLAPGADADHDGSLSGPELEAGRAEIERGVVERVEVLADGTRCQGSLVDAHLVEADGVKTAALYACQEPPRQVKITLRLFDKLAHGHRHLASLSAGEKSIEAVLYDKAPSLMIEPPGGAGAGAGAGEGGEKPAGGSSGKQASAFELFKLGVGHILEGYDHLAFLLGLVIVGGRFRGLLAVVTAFTLAHSISLAMAVLGVWAPSPRIVEPLIALSIAFVGVENFWVKDASRRWRITFPFGLVHGFGFAGGLIEAGVPRAKIPLALVMFNLGVEAGQLAVLAVVLPLVIRLGKTAWFRDKGIRAVNGALVAAGLYWFVERVFFGG